MKGSTTIWSLTLISFLLHDCRNCSVEGAPSVREYYKLLKFHRDNVLTAGSPKTEQPEIQTSEDVLNPYPGKPRLTFKPDGTFKLTVFSDLHFGENPSGPWGPEQDVNSTVLMRTVLGDEKPDYV